MNRWIVVIFVLLGIWQIVGSLIEKAGKKQQAQRLKDLAAQRERQMSARGEHAPPSRTTTDRAETLAARRRAQLEQLRKRRTDRRTIGEVSAGPGRQTGSAPAAPSRAPRGQVTFQPAGPAQAPPPSRPAPWTQPQTRPAPPRPPRPMPARAAVAAPEPPTAEITDESSARSLLADASARRQARKSHLPPRPVLPDQPMSSHVLRQMVLFREILEPPVSLRDRQVWERL